MRKWVMFFIIISLLATLLIACADKKDDISFLVKLKQALASANTQYDKIYHVEPIKDGVLLFYTNDNALYSAFIRESFNKWEFVNGGGSTPLKSETPLSFHGANFKEVTLWLSYGVISDENIYKLSVEQDYTNMNMQQIEEKKNANIIMIEDGIRFWYVIWNEPSHPPAKYTAFNADGEVIYKRGF